LLLFDPDMRVVLRRSNRAWISGGMRLPHGILQHYEILPVLNDSAASLPADRGFGAVREADAW
jgi:hypothetical protein